MGLLQLLICGKFTWGEILVALEVLEASSKDIMLLILFLSFDKFEFDVFAWLQNLSVIFYAFFPKEFFRACNCNNMTRVEEPLSL